MYDEPVAVPILDLLDSQMMTQYISAAREQYNQALQEQKEFAKEFGDIYSPSYNLNKAYYDATKGAVNKAMDYLYQNGIDPVRSAEGRAYIAKVIRERPYADLAKWKMEADNMKTYQKAAAEMVASGRLTQDQLDWQMDKQGLNYDTFDPYSQSWNALSPTKMDSLEDLTKLNFSMLKPSDLTKEQVESMGYKYDPYNDYTGITNQMLVDTAGQAIPNVMSSTYGEYYYDKAKRELQQAGVQNPTDDQIKSHLQNTVAGLWSGKVTIDHEPNKYKLIDYQTAKENWLDAQKTARDTAAQKEILNMKSSLKGGGSGTNGEPTVFDLADARVGNAVWGQPQSDYEKAGIALADPGATWQTSNSTTHYDADGNQVKDDAKTARTITQKRTTVTFTDNGSVHYANNGAFTRAKNMGHKYKGSRLYNTPEPAKITADITGGLTKNQDNGRYYVKGTVVQLGNSTTRKGVGDKIWIEVTPGFQGTPSSKANNTDD